MLGRRSQKTRLVTTLLCVFAVVAMRPAWADDAGGRARPHDLAQLEQAVAEVEALANGAHFEKAIEVAEATRRWADEVPRGPKSQEARGRMEVSVCTAQVALGDDAGALGSMERAVYAWPLLSLDESNASPRVVRLFRKLRDAPDAGKRR
jgi:hypothetical protein